jgi:hypothetical protein
MTIHRSGWDGDTNSYDPGNALVTFEAFKVWGGEIHAINAFFRIRKRSAAGRPGVGRVPLRKSW